MRWNDLPVARLPAALKGPPRGEIADLGSQQNQEFRGDPWLYERVLSSQMTLWINWIDRFCQTITLVVVAQFGQVHSPGRHPERLLAAKDLARTTTVALRSYPLRARSFAASGRPIVRWKKFKVSHYRASGRREGAMRVEYPE